MKDNIIIENKFSYDFNHLKNPRKFGDLLLYQLGEIYCNNSAVVEPHIHNDFFELTYIISGTGIIYAGNTPTEVKKNDLFVSLPYERHEIISDKVDPLRYYYIAFSFETGAEFKEILYDQRMLSLSAASRTHNISMLGQTFVELISTLENDTLNTDIKYELLVKILCINVCQIYRQITTKTYSSPNIDNEQNLYYRTMNYIDHNLTKIGRLTDIADKLNYNYVYISRIFKRKFGKSIYTYYSDKKLELAKQMLEENKATITEISDYLNYSSIYVFSRIFKKRFGISPSTYKQQSAKKK